jgi:hypothetical protein
MILTSLPYLSGDTPSRPGPLARFLPPLEEGSAAPWLTDHVPPGAWLLDPFGFSPVLPVEAARAGFRVVVAANNPVTRFLLEARAHPIPAADLKAALAELAASRKGEERLESHIQSIYLTPCAACKKEIPARSFLWKKGADAPFARVYTCPHCGDQGERPADPADAARARQTVASASLHRARVLERVAPLNDPDRVYAEEALDHCLPRSIYALTTLINRLDGLALSTARRRALTALLLSACDQANSLWPHPTERPRPRQLSVPPQFVEYNLWTALEDGIALWADESPEVPLAVWPQKPPETGGVCIYEGKLSDLAGHIQETPIHAVVAAIPRPNQAFWTLSALWAGWLWGQEAAEPFRVALRRRRYDWDWHAEALYAAFYHLYDLLPAGVPFLGFVAEPEPPFLTATLAAADASGFALDGIAARTPHDPVQVAWMRREERRPENEGPSVEAIRARVREMLTARGEAATYLHVHAAGLAGQAGAGGLIRARQPMTEAVRGIASTLYDALADGPFQRFGGTENPETGLWGLADGQESAEPLPDRVEMAVVRFLARAPSSSLAEIEREIYRQFPGLLTPPRALIGAVLDSYALMTDGHWRLRPEDQPSRRREDVTVMAGLLESIGARLEYTVRREEETLLVWEEDGRLAWAFHLLASALVGRVVAEPRFPLEHSLIVLPGGRAGLVAYKSQRDPLLRKQLEGWRFVKFRVLRALGEIPILTRQTWVEQIASDPIARPEGQLMMF